MRGTQPWAVNTNWTCYPTSLKRALELPVETRDIHPAYNFSRKHFRMTFEAASSRLTHPKYRADIDGLRALAVLSVVVFHAFPALAPGGFIGVDVFFVISGFLISTILFENLERGSFTFREFYKRRIKRIFPALLLVLFASLIAGWYLLLDDEFQLLGKHVAAGAGFVSNILLWREIGYFDVPADSKPLLHLWSLGIEEQFYILWPPLIWLAWRVRSSIPKILLIATAASFLLNIYLVQKNPMATFYLPFTRFWELLVGSCLAYFAVYFKEQFTSRDVRTLNLHSFLGGAMLVAAMALTSKESVFPGWWALLPTVGAALIIASGPQTWLNRYILSNRLLVWFGLISFPLYLWHWPLLAYLRITQGEIPALSDRIAAVVAAIVLAWVTYRFVEVPIRSSKHARFSVTKLIWLMILVGLIGLACNKNLGFIPSANAAPLEQRDSPFVYNLEDFNDRKCQDKDLTDGIALTYCSMSQKGPIDAAIIGDSHADDKFRGMVKLDSDRNWMLIGNASCPPVLGIKVEADQKDCDLKFIRIFDWLAKQKAIKTVVFSSYGNYQLTTSYAWEHLQLKNGPESIRIDSPNKELRTRDEMMAYGLGKGIEKVLTSGKKVIVFVDTPELPFSPRDCVRRKTDCKVPIQEVADRQRSHRAILDGLKKKYPSISIFDPKSLYCTNTECGFKSGETVVFRDSHHLSIRGSDLFAGKFLEFMQRK